LSEPEFEDFQAPLLYGCDLCFVAGKGIMAKNFSVAVSMVYLPIGEPCMNKSCVN